ncbi:MAG: hypothetical protein U0931_28765 [Vulcanimicrobiota bacterium]
MRVMLLFLMMLVGSPAPVWRFDGEDFYLIDRSTQPGSRVLAFLRDGDNPESCERRLWLRKVACKDLRAYELSYTRSWDQSQRDVKYRSAIRLVHSGWVQKGQVLEWRLMDWERQGDSLVCAEMEIATRGDGKLLVGLVNRQYDNWRSQLSGMMKQAPGLLNQR